MGRANLWLTALFLLAGAGSATAATVTPVAALPDGAKALSLHAVGRMQGQGDGGKVTYRHQWPGVYFEAAFTGDAAYLGFDDKTNEYRLTLDGADSLPIVKPGKAWLAVRDLGPGLHRLRLEKVTESIDQTEVFSGVYIPAGETAAPAPADRIRRIEFIGDSGMTGYGIRSTTRTCTHQEVHDLTDSQAAWPVLTAKHFDADYQVNAISGRGLIRNYNGTTPGLAMGDVYPFTFFDKTFPTQDAHWRPDIVMIALGGNDFSSDVKPGEAWTSQQQLAVAFFAAYGRFIVDLHRRYPAASVVVQWPATTDDAEFTQLSHVGIASMKAAAGRAGLKHFVIMSPPDGFAVDTGACDYHASAAGHRKGADWAIGWLTGHPELWR